MFFPVSCRSYVTAAGILLHSLGTDREYESLQLQGRIKKRYNHRKERTVYSMDGLKLSELEIGKEYFLFSRQYSASNRVKYLGSDKEVYPTFFKETEGVRGIGYFEYNNRMNHEQFAIHEFELGLGFSEITTTHQKGVLIS